MKYVSLAPHRLLQNVVPGEDDGPVASLSLHGDAVHLRQLSGVQPGWPELSLLQDQHPQPVLEVAALQLSRPQRLHLLLAQAGAGLRPGCLVSRLGQPGLLVFFLLR